MAAAPSWGARPPARPGSLHPARDPAPRLSLLYPFHVTPDSCDRAHILGSTYQACHILKTPQGGNSQSPQMSHPPLPLLAPPAPAGIFRPRQWCLWGQEGVTLLWSHASVPVHLAGKAHMAQSLGGYSDILGASPSGSPSQLMFPGRAGYQAATHTPSFPTGSWRCQGQGLPTGPGAPEPKLRCAVDTARPTCLRFPLGRLKPSVGHQD